MFKVKTLAVLLLAYPRHFVAACFYGNGGIHSHARARGLSMRTHLTAVEPEVAILGADQKERGLWGREWLMRNWNHGLERKMADRFPEVPGSY